MLLGEASHGTAEFYRARAAIMRHLVERHGLIVAVKADWPDAAVIDRYVRSRPARTASGPAFRRFPDWMWRNTEILALTRWMRDYNARAVETSQQVGSFGLDMYNLSASMAAVLAYLDEVDPDVASHARERCACLSPWHRDPERYGRLALKAGYQTCEDAVLKQCRALLARELDYASRDGDDFLDAVQNARLVTAAERYYRIMYQGGAESWNLRDRHMFETLEHVLEARGSDARAVVWVHNSHIGDARFTEMGRDRNELNIGQLSPERFGSEATLIGFGTHNGTVAAAHDWEGDTEVMQVRPSHPDSYERQCHEAGPPRFLPDLREGRHEALRTSLLSPRIKRFIGVIYRPETELFSHYAEATLPEQFDAYVWFDETHAITPLEPEHAIEPGPDTCPFGL